MSAAARSGTLLEGRWRLGRRIGAGATGEVWEAADTVTGAAVAVKIVHASLADLREVRDRFRKEAAAGAGLSHPALARTFATGEHGGVPYMVMELCRGETLDEVIRARGAVGAGYACDLMTQVLDALEVAHAAGLVHRDLKPANVMVVHPRPDQPRVKVLDFGIAKGVHGEHQEAEEIGKLFGTPATMAPEQAAGLPVDHRADLYAVGAMLYELLTGRPPFSGPTVREVLMRVLTLPPKPMRAFVRHLPEGLEAVVRRALAKDPADRPSSAVEFREALRAFVTTSSGMALDASLRERGNDRDSLPPLPLVPRLPMAPRRAQRPTLELVEPAPARLELVSESVPPPPPPDDPTGR